MATKTVYVTTKTTILMPDDIKSEQVEGVIFDCLLNEDPKCQIVRSELLSVSDAPH